MRIKRVVWLAVLAFGTAAAGAGAVVPVDNPTCYVCVCENGRCICQQIACG